MQPVLDAFIVDPEGHVVQTPLNGHWPLTLPVHGFVSHTPEAGLKYLVASVHAQKVPSVVGTASEGQESHGFTNPLVDHPPV